MTRIECDGCDERPPAAMEEKWAWINWRDYWKEKGKKPKKPFSESSDGQQVTNSQTDEGVKK